MFYFKKIKKKILKQTKKNTEKKNGKILIITEKHKHKLLGSASKEPN